MMMMEFMHVTTAAVEPLRVPTLQIMNSFLTVIPTQKVTRLVLFKDYVIVWFKD